MKIIPFALMAAAEIVSLTIQANSIEYAGSCRGSSATVIEVGGFDTPMARAVAQVTLPDAISYCNYFLGRAKNKGTPTPGAIRQCAENFLRETSAGGPRIAEANCKAGTIKMRGNQTTGSYKMPVEPICGGDLQQVMQVFQMLCPSYEGKTNALE